jgi:hypothetical protein
MHRDRQNALFLELSSTSRKFKGSRAATGKTARPVTIYGGSVDEISKMNFSFLFKSPQKKIACRFQTIETMPHVSFFLEL